MVAQDDRALAGGRDLVHAWQAGMAVTTTHHLSLPADLLGRYRLRVFVYQPDAPLTFLFMDAQGAPTADASRPLVVRPPAVARVVLPPEAALASFGGQIYLLDVETQPPAAPGDPFTVVTSWTASAATEANYTIFAHLVGANGEILGQQDQQPGAGRYPTSIWEPGELMTDTLQITLPPGTTRQTACLRLGLYDSATMTRLPRAGFSATGDEADYWQATPCWKLP